MKIELTDLTSSVDVLKGFGAKRIWLFGSALQSPENVRDIDLGCEGVPPENFYRAVGQLLQILGKRVDLVDLTQDTRLARHIKARGRLLYDAR